MRNFLFAVALLFFWGCTTLKPIVAEYRIKVQDDAPKSMVKECKEKSLKVAQAFSQSALFSLQMEYAETNNKVFAYSQSQWQESPNSFVSAELFQNIRDFELFGSTHPFGSRVKTDMILETNIEEFMQYFSQDMNSSYVQIGLSFTLLDAKTNGVVATKTVRSKVETKTADAAGGVEAFGKALKETTADTRVWLEERCR